MKKIVFLILSIFLTLIFTACSSDNNETKVVDDNNNKVTVLDGYIKDANVTDSVGNVGIYSSSGQYIFSNSIVYPLSAIGGTIEGTNILFDINMTAQEGTLVVSPITTFLENNSTLLDKLINLGLGSSTLGEFSVDYISTNNSNLAKLAQLLYIVQKDTNLTSTFKTELIYNSPSSLDELFNMTKANVQEKIHSLYVDNYLKFLQKVKDLNVTTTAYETELMTLKAGLDIDFNPISYDNIIYNTIISPYTGKAWLDRNLGAYTSCVDINDVHCKGDYYQWGRDTDGHEKDSSLLSSTTSSSVTDAGVDFITGLTDWTTSDSDATQRKLSWSAADGSSICPVGFRVPTIKELAAETIDVGASSNTDMFNNFLKFSSNGIRVGSSGEHDNNISYGALWSSDINDSNSTYLYFDGSNAKISNTNRINGLNVRCIKD